MNAAENQKLRELYRTIEAEGGAAALMIFLAKASTTAWKRR